MTGNPPVRRRLLGAALRRYRENLGFGLDEAAQILECDRSKISRIETGQRGIRAKELRELLTEYGVPDDEQAALLAVAHRGRQHGWWQDYPGVLSDAAQDYVIMEAAAEEILTYEAHQVPDLLQTREYARALADADPACTEEEQRAQAVEVKLIRQRVVLAERSPRLEFVIAEAALHQVVGGTEVMRPQLARLASLAGEAMGTGSSGLSLQVLPFAAGALAAVFRLGWRYEHGQGVWRNAHEAERCYSKSARLGNAHAQSRLAESERQDAKEERQEEDEDGE